MSQIITKLNPLYEAMHYLNNKATGQSCALFAEEVTGRNPHLKSLIQKLYEPAYRLEHILNEELTIDEQECNHYFKPSAASASRYYPALSFLCPTNFCGFITDLDELTARFRSLPERVQLYRFLCYINSEGDLLTDYRGMVERILEMNIEDEYKLKIINMYNSFDENTERLAAFVRPVVDCIKKHEHEFDAVVAQWSIDNAQPENAINSIEGMFNFKCPAADYILFPSIFVGFLFDLTYWTDPDSLPDCGDVLKGQIATSVVMHQYINALCEGNGLPKMVRMLKGLADDTRMEILDYIKDEPSYGQAIADKYGLMPQKVFYHMSRLLESGIVDCNASSGKSYYSLNRKAIRELITMLEQYAD